MEEKKVADEISSTLSLFPLTSFDASQVDRDVYERNNEREKMRNNIKFRLNSRKFNLVYRMA